MRKKNVRIGNFGGTFLPQVLPGVRNQETNNMKSVFAGERYGYLTLLLIVITILCGCENTQPTRLPNNGIKASV